MLTGIALLMTLAAEPQPEPAPKLQLPKLQLVLLGQGSPGLPSVEDWPVEPQKKLVPGTRSRESKLNLVAPIVVTSIGAAILGLSALGFSASCSKELLAGDGLAGGFVCLAGVIVFGGIGVLSGVVFLIGAIWLVADLVLNSHEASGIEPAKPSLDSGQAPPPASPGLVLARF